MANLCKFEKEQKYVSYDGGQTWQPLEEYRKGELIERSSPDCGEIGDRYRWTLIDNDYICVGKDTYTKYVYQVSHDGGLYWYNVYPTQYQAGELVEQNSDFCNNATEGHYNYDDIYFNYDPIWITKCDEGGTVITENDIRKTNQCLTSITISDCVIGIGDNAFKSQCLLSITIPDSVTSIGNSAFQYCQNLTSVTIPNSVTTIGSNTFRSCTSLSSIAIPSGVTSIGASAFYSCSNLINIIIPNSVTSIGLNAFNQCRSLTSITVNATTPPTLGADVFNNTSDCPIYVPCASVDTYKTTTGWSDYASRIYGISPCVEPTPPAYKFIANYSDSQTYSKECDSSSVLTSGETRPSGYDYYNLTSATIGDCVTSIGYQAFYDFTSLSSVTIPSSVTSIGEEAFGSCTSLSSVTIPSGVTRIDRYGFINCDALTSITINATTPPTLGANAFMFTNDCTIYVPCESVNAYKTADGWSLYADIIQGIPPCGAHRTTSGTPYCEGYDKYVDVYHQISYDSGQTWETTATTPTLVEADSEDCGYVPPTNVKIYATYSGGQTYSKECDSSTSLTSGETKPSGYDYSAMASAVIGDCVTSIGSSAFTNCISLSSVTIGSGVTSIGQYAFYECSSLTSVTIPSGVTSISNRTFTECTSLTSVTIPSGVTRIGQYAFYYCSGLTSITVEATTPPTLPRGYYAFHATNDCPIYVPSQSVDAYKAASGWSSYASRIYPIS